MAPLCDPPVCLHREYLAFIRSSTSTRWGSINLLGVLTESPTRDAAAKTQDSLTLGEVTSTSFATNLLHQKETGRITLNRVREGRGNYHRRQSAVNTYFHLGGICLLDQLKLYDVRVFYWNSTVGEQTCVVATAGPDPHANPSIVCLSYSLTPARPRGQCPYELHITTLPRQLASRNLVPLVGKGYNYRQYSNRDVWLVDFGIPLIFSASFGNKNNHSDTLVFNLEGCEYISGWHGSSPVIQLTARLWVTIVHSYVLVSPSKKNKLGRQYQYRFVQLLSASAQEPPTRCLKSEHPDYINGLPEPFVFILGLVYVGIHKPMPFETVHRFIVSGAIDDKEPFLANLDVHLDLAQHS